MIRTSSFDIDKKKPGRWDMYMKAVESSSVVESDSTDLRVPTRKSIHTIKTLRRTDGTKPN